MCQVLSAGVGEKRVNKMGKTVCLRGADILVSTKVASTHDVYCLFIRRTDLAGHLLCVSILQSVIRRPSENVGAGIFKELQILAD